MKSKEEKLAIEDLVSKVAGMRLKMDGIHRMASVMKPDVS